MRENPTVRRVRMRGPAGVGDRGDVYPQTSGTSGEEWELVCSAGSALLLFVQGCVCVCVHPAVE